ncbi:MAG: DUF2953 domain-containing protein [Hungatella sp.]|nr:DUF2953 domain-containing protein [Hungatella sp.]
MLPILLMVLKITGIVILALLGLVLLGLLAVLLVPVRYSVSGSYYGKAKGSVKVTWLFRAVSVNVTYEDGLDGTLRMLGKRLFHIGGEESGQKGDGAGAFTEADGALRVDYVENAKEEDIDSFGTENGKRAEKDAEIDSGTEKPRDGEEPERSAGREACRQGPEPCLEEDKKTQYREERAAGSRIRFYGEDSGEEPEAEDCAESPKTEKLKNLVRSVKAVWNRAAEYKDRGLAFWNDEANQKTIRLVLRQVQAIVRHLLPTKIQGKAVFGFEDPGTTGKVLAAFGIVYGMYGDHLQIVPVFDRKVLEAEGSLKGRVQAGVIGARCVRVLLNKNFRRLLRGLFRNGGE